MPTTRERIVFSKRPPPMKTKCRPTAGNSPLPFGRVKVVLIRRCALDRFLSHLSSGR
jgi:hypothetical protein